MKFRPFSIAITVIIGVILSIEAANQAYVYITQKQGVIAILRQETKYITNEYSKLKLLNPKYSTDGFFVNSLGLRSDEISNHLDNASLKIVFIGASTVMGEMAPSNHSTFAHLTGQSLEKAWAVKVMSINAGIAGYRIVDQIGMVRHVTKTVKPDLVVIYPGFNDVADYCLNSKPRESKGLIYLNLPEWWISFNTLRRRTDDFRPAQPNTNRPASSTIDYVKFKNDVSDLLDLANLESKNLVLVTGVRAFSSEQDEATQWKLAASVRGYTSCLSMSELNQTYDHHNEILRGLAKEKMVPLLDLAKEMPVDLSLFADATHFSSQGELFVSDRLSDFIQSNVKFEAVR